MTKTVRSALKESDTTPLGKFRGALDVLHLPSRNLDYNKRIFFQKLNAAIVEAGMFGDAHEAIAY